MISYRDRAYSLHVAKLIAFGYDDLNVIVKTWTTPTTYSFTTLDETTSFTGPTYEQNSVTKTDLNFEFYDLSTVQSGPLNWITIDPSTFVVTVTPTLQEY